MARGTREGVAHSFDHVHRAADELDYWDGEP
jgi:hypothetical protein